MKNQSFNILFIMRSTRIKKNGLASIYPRITTGGMRLSESVARTAQRGAGISVRHPRRRQQGRTMILDRIQPGTDREPCTVAA